MDTVPAYVWNEFFVRSRMQTTTKSKTAKNISQKINHNNNIKKKKKKMKKKKKGQLKVITTVLTIVGILKKFVQHGEEIFLYAIVYIIPFLFFFFFFFFFLFGS